MPTQVDQQIAEIDKLNSIINGIEREMLRLKRQYEMAVEQRNYTGTRVKAVLHRLDWTGLDWARCGRAVSLARFVPVPRKCHRSSATIRSSPVPHSHR